jgi:DNA-binding CsgD family transcriptional regulator
MSMGAATLIGRDEELAAVQTWLAEVGRSPSALVLSGEAGIGKTVLWEAGLVSAEGRVGRVLISRGVEAEASLAFAGLSELLAPVFEEAAPSLVAPRRRALEVALLLAEPGDDAPDAHAIGLAVLDVLRALVERGSVLVALDDVQWLDPASAGVLQVAFRRLRQEPVGLLATVRRAPDVAIPFELDRSFPEERLARLTLGPLTAGALHRLLRERLGLELTRPELARVQEATAGNPFFALELGRELVRTGRRPAPGEALRVPDSLRELLGGRLARLPGETLDVLLQVAALARPTVEVVAAAHGNRERVLRALEAAVAEGVIALDDARLRFAHPLLASICYEEAPVWKRRAVHRVLADAVSDVEERARHLALAAEAPDDAIAAELEAAAAHAAARGATAAAGGLCELAAELTPGDDAPARARLFRAANFHRLAGDSERAATLLRRLLEEVPSGVERADALLALAITFRADPRTNVALCDEALAHVAGDDARCARILGLRSGHRLLGADVHGARADARAALEMAERVGEPALIADTIARVGHTEFYGSDITPGLLERGAEIEERLGLQFEYFESARYGLARLRLRRGEIEGPRVLLAALEAEAAARGDEGSRGQYLWFLSLLEWLAGDWPRALELAVTAHELAEQTRHGHGLLWVARAKALVEADLGLVEEARASAEGVIAQPLATSNDFYTIISLGMLGRVEFALGNLDAAAGYLRELPGRLLAQGITEPMAPVWADAIEVLSGVGEVADARMCLEAYEENAWRLQSPWAMAAAARSRGLVEAAAGSPEPALAAFEGALAGLAEHPYPLERGRTFLCQGAVLRQAGRRREARQALEGALVIFEELGARLWAERARAELQRISGRAPASDELTETERRVAELAARGRTNREIAAELYMGVSTVEAHLSRVYRKLGVRRAELAGRLGETAAR